MIKITADSTCDLSPKILRTYAITLIPLYTMVDAASYKDGVDITPADVFRHSEAGRRVRTAAVNPLDYERVFGQYAKEFDAVIHISIGAAFSSCYQNALDAARRFPNVHVVDSMNLSTGSGLVAMEAAEMAALGMDAEEIVRRLQTSIPLVDASFVIDNLDYLKRGGRCSGLEAVGARLLQIKPCIEVVNGAMKVGAKYRGSFTHCLEHYARDRLAGRQDIDFRRVFITHPACAPGVVGLISDLVKSIAPFEEVLETRAGCTVSNHCGPETLGILFKRTRPKTAVEAH
jgi:DegV family protein with EDD domain